MRFRVADTKHYKETDHGTTLSLRVSIDSNVERTPDLLYQVGCAVAEKYQSEGRWNLLIFSDYRIAKHYKAPYPKQSEPREYIGACMGIRDTDGAQVKCGVW